MSKKDIKPPELSIPGTPEELPVPPPPAEDVGLAVLKLRPDQWATSKGLLSVLPNGQVNQRKPPYRFNLMRTIARWPDPNIDPHFLITEEEFTKVFEGTEKL